MRKCEFMSECHEFDENRPCTPVIQDEVEKCLWWLQLNDYRPECAIASRRAIEEFRTRIREAVRLVSMKFEIIRQPLGPLRIPAFGIDLIEVFQIVDNLDANGESNLNALINRTESIPRTLNPEGFNNLKTSEV